MSFLRIPNAAIFLFLTLVLGYLLVENLRYDKTAISYNLFEVTYPFLFSFVAFGIFSEEIKDNLLERISIIPDSLIYIFTRHIRRAGIIWLVLGIIGFFLFLPLLKQNNHLMVLCLFSNILFWSGIYLLNESLGYNALFGIVLSFLLFVFWLFPRVQQLIGDYGIYRFANPFFLTFHHSSPGWAEKLTLGLIGIFFYSLSYVVLKRKIYIKNL